MKWSRLLFISFNPEQLHCNGYFCSCNGIRFIHRWFQRTVKNAAVILIGYSNYSWVAVTLEGLQLSVLSCILVAIEAGIVEPSVPLAQQFLAQASRCTARRRAGRFPLLSPWYAHSSACPCYLEMRRSPVTTLVVFWLLLKLVSSEVGFRLEENTD